MTLGQKLKEPRDLLFFKGSFYEFTYNEDSKFSQSQIGLLINLPGQEIIDEYMTIPILVAPPGFKDMEYDREKHIDQYIDEGWVVHNVGIYHERTQSIRGNLRDQRI